MKKTTRIKSAALVLVVLMMVQLLGTSGISMIASAAQSGASYTADFSSGDWESLASSGNWSVETNRRPATAPTVSDGVLKFDTKDGVLFNWISAIGGTGNYDSSKRYVFEFDVKVTNSGNGFTWDSSNYTRVMYLALGGWYTILTLNDSSGNLNMTNGSQTVPYSAQTFENNTMHYKTIIEGTTLSAYVFDENNSLIASGSRDINSPASDTETQTFGIRCEDGAFELDNFSFEVKDAPVLSEVSSTDISVPSGKQAIYTATVTHTSGESTTVSLGSTELFSISDTGMRVCGVMINGSYGEGDYGVKLYINPSQKMLLTEITLPDGGIVRRGAASLLGGSSVKISSYDEDKVTDVGVTYSDISVASYTLTETEPNPFSSNIYNIVSSFSDARSDRLFAFTTNGTFSASATMSLKYREKGAQDWSSVDATKCAEPTNVSAEDYFKAEISGLKANTEYEYKVGKKGSSAESDWSAVYSFTTAPKSIKEFSFIAIGDPQANNWNGFKYAKVALDEAIKEVPNPAFIFNAGDIVDSGYRPAEWNSFFNAMGTYGTNFANFVAIGNHDTRNSDNVLINSNKNNYFSFYFNHPSAPENALVVSDSDFNKLSASGKVQVNSFDETVYSYNYGEAHFVVLNTGTYANTGNETYPDDKIIIEAQRAWLESDLEANKDAKWTIIMLHEAIYHRKGGKQDRNYIVDIIDKYKVDLVLEGHSHLVTRTYPLVDGEIVTKSNPDLIEKGTGTIYMTIGSTTTGHDTLSGANVELMQTIISPENEQPAYTTVTIRGTDLILTTKQANGLILDSFTIRGTEEFGSGEVIGDEPTDEPDNGNDGETTTEPESNLPETTTPATEETTPVDESTEPIAEEGGCGGTVGIAGLALMTALGTCAVFATKKKEG